MSEVGNTALDVSMVRQVPRGTAATNSDRKVILSESLPVLDPATDRFIREQMPVPFVLGRPRPKVLP